MPRIGAVKLATSAGVAALCLAALAACVSAPPLQPAEIVDRVGKSDAPARYPAVALVSVSGPDADVFAEALGQAMKEHGVSPVDAESAAYRLAVVVTRSDETIAATEVRAEIDADFALSPVADGAASRRTVYRELAIRTIPGGRESGQILLNNAARAATQIAAAVGSVAAGIAVPSIVTPKVEVPSEYRALRAAKQDAMASIIRQFLSGLGRQPGSSIE